MPLATVELHVNCTYTPSHRTLAVIYMKLMCTSILSFVSGFPFFDSDDETVSVDKSCLLLRYILQTLTKCFLYDKSGFLTKERFDTLLQPLVDQV